MKIKKNGKVIKLTESDLKKILKRVIEEELTFNVNDPEFGIDGEMMKRDSGTWSYFDPKRNKYNTRQGVYGDHNEDEYSEEWEDYEFDDFTDLKRSDIPNDDWRDLRTRKGFDSMKGDDGKVRIRKNPYKYRRQSGTADIRIREQSWDESESRPVSFTEEDREMLTRIYDVVVRGGSAGGYGGVRRRAIPALGTLPDLNV